MNWEQKTAYIISRIFGPLPLLCVLWLITALRSGIGFWRALWVYPLIFFIDIVIPFGIMTFLIYTKRVKNIEWSDVQQRNKYLIPLALVAIPTLLVLTYLLTNAVTFHLSLLFCVILAAILSVYKFLHFKASSHIAMATITIAGVCLFYGLQFLWLYILLLPIAWARKTLKVHTTPEIIAGFAIPSIFIIVALILFGWPNIPK